jgi:hypothetical protein
VHLRLANHSRIYRELECAVGLHRCCACLLGLLLLLICMFLQQRASAAGSVHAFNLTALGSAPIVLAVGLCWFFTQLKESHSYRSCMACCFMRTA